VGFEEDVLVDVVGLELEQEDSLVLCCDGLTNLVADPRSWRSPPARVSPRRRSGSSPWPTSGGGDDNITVIVVRVDGEKQA